MDTLKNYVGGRGVDVEAEEQLEVPDPATGEVLAQVPLSGETDIDRAVRVAAGAFEEWREEPVTRRARRMFRLQVLLEDHIDELSELATRENGKHVEESEAEIRRGIEVVELAASMTSLMKGETLDQVSRGVDVELHREPLGVVAAITPFNFPMMIPLWFAPLAIATGNTFILKPSQRTPLSAMRLAEFFTEAGFPDGVFNVVHGARETVEALIDHPEVEAISSVGSSAAAKNIYQRSAARGKRVQALGGAKNHIVVMPDADLELAAPGVFSSAFSNGGQRCLAGSVGVAVGGIGDELVERLADIAKSATVGSGLNREMDSDASVTPVTTEEARERIKGYIDKGQEEGARLVVDGREQYEDGEGFFLGATIFDGVSPEMEIAQEEIFGPVLAVERMQDLDEAIKTINESPYGNAAAIFTRDGAAARKFRREVQCGMIGVNISVPAPVAYFPFTGWKDSFFGDLHATGTDGVEFYTERKVVIERWQ
ncbi:MAG TPA: CoA-acylating methylmalonate-semialdehyde dehydrogenase [Rubrobacteraceae bacterium]|nr:CoA-acylating methylmalonate-semialdehyde dehydrogenase [Rubrobacteraceae bacterium]